MTRTATKGTCQLCHGVFSKGAMSKHLEACRQKTDVTATSKATKKASSLHLLVEGRDLPQYWMHLEIPATTTLQKLDSFLRDTWLECCGHLSKFDIADVSYASYVDPEFGDKSMRAQVGSILGPGQQFLYEYDYGTTTELHLKIIDEHEGQAKEKSIRVLASNEAPLIVCNVCGKPATEVCSQCIFEDSGWLCEACAKEHECGEDMLLPVVNSPRVGMCAYEG